MATFLSACNPDKNKGCHSSACSGCFAEAVIQAINARGDQLRTICIRELGTVFHYSKTLLKRIHRLASLGSQANDSAPPKSRLHLLPMATNSEGRKVAIVYHYFPNYRAAINEHLESESPGLFVFYGDKVNRIAPGVPVWKPSPQIQFRSLRGFFVGKQLLFQPGALLVPFRRDLKTVIFLGECKIATTWVAAILSRLMGKQVLFWSHGWLTPETGLKKVVRNAFYRLGHGMLLYGNEAKRIGVASGFPEDRLHVLFNSLDYAKQKAVRNEVSQRRIDELKQTLFGSAKGDIVGIVGRLTEGKNLELLIDAVEQLGQSGWKLQILFIGDGPAKEALSRHAESKSVGCLFYGACHDEEEIGPLLMCCSATVCPSGAGLSVIHSLSYGIPVVVSDENKENGPEVEAVVPGLTGENFSSGDVESLTDSILRCVTQKSSTRADDCRKVVENFYSVSYQSDVISRALANEEPLSGGPEVCLQQATSCDSNAKAA